MDEGGVLSKPSTGCQMGNFPATTAVRFFTTPKFNFEFCYLA